MKLFFRYSSILLSVVALAITSCKTNILARSTDYEHKMTIINSNLAEDTVFVNYIAPFKAQLEAKMNTVIGQSAQLLPRAPQHGQSLGGNFFADALLTLGKEVDPEVSCSLGTAGGIRTDIASGDVTVGHIFELMPFENYVTVLELKGSDMLILGNFIAKSNGQPIGGMSIIIKDKEMVDLKVQGTSIDPQKTYKLVTYDYLANGGDYVEGLSNPIKRKDTSTRIREGLISYIERLTKQGKTLNAQLDERVKIIQ